MKIRDASASDAEVLTEVMRSAKRSWGYPEEWLQAWAVGLTITPEDVSTMRIGVAESSDGLLGFYGLAGLGRRVQLEHLWVRPDQMGKGIGRALVEHALAEVARKGGEIVVIESDPNAEPFYRRMGAVGVGAVPAPMPGAPNRTLPLLELRVGDSTSRVSPESAR